MTSATQYFRARWLCNSAGVGLARSVVGVPFDQVPFIPILYIRVMQQGRDQG